MPIPISQSDAVDMFDLPTVMLYVCDGGKECGKPCCRDLANDRVCHHTEDMSHALYDEHFIDDFEQFPTIRDDGAAIVRVEPIRG